MSIVQALIGAIASSGSGSPPTPSLNIYGYVSSMNEGSTNTVYVDYANYPPTTIYWQIVNDTTVNEDWVTAEVGGIPLGSFAISGTGISSFSWTAAEDLTTEGNQTYYLNVGTSVGGNDLVSAFLTINDTSLTKLQLTSGTALGFNGADNRHVIVSGNQSDWNLGDNWTIEWWQKIPVDASGFLSVLCQDANVPTYSGIDVFVNAGNICMFNGNFTVAEAPATRGEWNHIAIQKNGTTLAAYINGVSRTVGGSHPGTIAPSSPLNVAIGSRTYDGGANFYGQYFNGQLSNIRISNTARYSETFTPPTTVVTDAGTLLALDGSTGSGGMLVDESSRHTLTNNGATVDTIA